MEEKVETVATNIEMTKES